MTWKRPIACSIANRGRRGEFRWRPNPDPFQMIELRIFPRSRTILLALAFTAGLGVASTAFSGPSPTQSEIPKLVAEASTFRPGDGREAFRRIEELVRESVTDNALRESLEAGMIKLLAPTSTFEARRFACKQLGIIGGKTALPALAGLLKSDETAGIACLALTTYPPGKADELLRLALSSSQGIARVQIIDTLGNRRDPRAVDLLAPLARNSDAAVAAAAIAALGNIGEKPAWNAIASLRKSVPANLSEVVTAAMLQCAAEFAVSGDKKMAAAVYGDLLSASEPAFVRRAAFMGLARLDKDEGEVRILQTLRGSDTDLKPVAIAAARTVASRDASTKFASQLPSLAPQEQAWMIEALAVRGDVPARNAIASSLTSTNSIVRRAAISALSQIGDASTVGLFARTLTSQGDADEHRVIETALTGLHGDNQIDQAVVVELKNSTGEARASLINVLARRQGSAANIVLFEETTNSNPVIARAAFRGLANTAVAGDAPMLLQKVSSTRDPEVRLEAEAAASQALGKIDDAADRSTLVREALRKAPSVEIITSLLVLLPRCGDAPALAVLQAAQADPNVQVRDAAIRALAEWPDDSAWDLLYAIYRRPANETVRRLALQGLIRLIGEENAHPDAKLMARYRYLIDSARGDTDPLRSILGALGSAAHPDALQLAYPLLENESVRPEAQAAVKKIAEAIKGRNPDAAAEALQKISQASK